MATFGSTGHTVFREGDPAIPDIAAEKRGASPSIPRSGSGASRRWRNGTGILGRTLRALRRRDNRSGGPPYELDEVLAAGLEEEAKRRGATERELLEEAVRSYLAARVEGGES